MLSRSNIRNRIIVRIENGPPKDRYEKKHSTVNLIISGFAVVISVIVALYAIWVYKETIKQTEFSRLSSKAAVDAVGIAKDTFKETKNYNDSTLKSQKESALSNEEESKKRFSLDSTSVKSQINSLKESQRRFELENEPYLEMRDFMISTNETNKVPKATWAIHNMGKHPVRMIMSRYTIYGNVTNFQFSEALFNGAKLTSTSKYITSQSPSGGSLILDSITKEKLSANLENKNYRYFIIGEMKYQNLITKKNKSYKMIISTNQLDNSMYTVHYSENEDIK